MVTGEPKKSPIFSQRSPGDGGSNNGENLFSPRFKSVAAMAGWDEETLLIASLIVDDTPDRECKNKKRMNITFKTPPSNSRRKRRDQQRANSTSIPVTVLNLDEEESPVKETKKETGTSNGKGRTEAGGSEMPVRGSPGSAPVASIPCMDKLREELSCAICLEICFEPSTTPCGHSFCKKCLRSAADKCGKRCPKCRQLMGNGRSCTVNTVLWNTIQLLFPNEIEARKACSTSSEIQDTKSQTRDGDRDISSHRHRGQQNVQTRAAQIVEARRSARNDDDSSGDIISINHHRRQQEVAQTRTRRAVETRNNEEDDDDLSFRRRRRALPAPTQDEDAALALRLQREEFMEVVRGRGSSHDSSRISIALARENLRAMASRAISVRLRHRAT